MTLTGQDIELFKMLLGPAHGFDISKFCFDKQLRFILDPSPFKVALCSRRAGKTVGCAADLIRTSLLKPKQTSLYITLSRNNAKKIIWGDLLEINRTFNLGALTNDTELSMKFPNGSVIYLSGAKDKSEIEKFRGLALSLCYIDEAQSFRDYIRDLVDEVIAKALLDNNGSLCLTGTPAPVPTGYFHECWSSKEWSVHEWTMFDNPWIPKKSGKTVQELLERELKRKGVTVDDPGIQREMFGKWTVDYDSLVFKYDKTKNDYLHLPSDSHTWNYIIGVDLGFEDSDAVAVLGYSPKSPICYLVEEVITAKQGITDLAQQLDKLIRKYNPDSVVMDTGGLGKKIAEEMNRRYSLPIKAAEKSRKFEYIEILNDALRTSRFFVKGTSRFAQDAMLVEWDKDSTQLKVSDRFHSDICDAALYAFRESLHWLSVPDEIIPKEYTPEWFRREEARLENQALKAMEAAKTIDDGHLHGINLTNDQDWD